MFKCSKDSGALYHSFQITLQNVFDIQVLQETTTYQLLTNDSINIICLKVRTMN